MVPSPDGQFTGRDELSVEMLVAQVLARNPSLAQMVAAQDAASARYPQVTSPDDPMFTGTVGPGSVGSNQVDFAYRVEVSQKYPFPGKLKLRGDQAHAEASAAGHDVEDMRLQLIESALNAYYDYYLVGRALEVNQDTLRLLREFRQNAETRFKAAQVPQQDVLQADVELGRQRERQLTLERMRQVAVARLNTLMHLPTNTPLPPPPREIAPGPAVPAVDVLQVQAAAGRPDLQALADRAAAEQAGLALAHKEFWPDFEVMAAYDAFWQRPEQDLRPQVGVRVNLPVRKTRRYGAIAEAEARLAQRRAELDRQLAQVNFQVQEAHAQVQESEKIVRLYTDTILPAAEANVKAAQSAYVTGKTPFVSLIEAQRGLVGLRERYYEAIAESFRRRAMLERAVGGLPAGAATACSP
ncbi:MAG: TolC family protein [Gemmataceae bacterium]|nr:TolC family protein [Gemmataceae bacterium]